MAIQRRESNIGDIRQSMLTESQFQTLNGTGWVMMDGRDVSGSGYSIASGITVLADARGLVLRGKNNGRSDGNQNPSGDVTIGTFQAHATAKNGLSVSDSGHQHGDVTNLGQGGTFGFSGYGGLATNGTALASVTLPLGSPAVANVSLGAGDAETRMSNITVNTFIKIN